MPTRTLNENTNLSLRFNVGSRRMFEFEVEAEEPVDTYVVDQEGYDAFFAREPIPSEGGFHNRRAHHQTLKLPHRGPWFLLIVNRRDEPVAVHYETYY